jgi:hypothetical protein|tara:strand:- start:1052 stop:1618 length:567 start_codon:yes stop_codon:yes gene_type:complete
MSEFIRIIIQILKIDKKFFSNQKNFGEASIYFAILIILISALISLIPNTAFIEYMSLKFSLGKVEGPSLRSVIIISYSMWIIKAAYLYFAGVIMFPNKNTKCNFRKILILVGYSHIPMFLNVLTINYSLLFLLIITYIWYNISLIVGLNIILNYKNIVKSILIVTAPFFILFIYLLSIFSQGQVHTIS